MFFAFVATTLVLLHAAPQSPPLSSSQAEDANKPAAQESHQQASEILFHVTTREALIDLIAFDDHNHPVADLKPEDLTVSEWWAARSEYDSSEKGPDTSVPPDAETAPVTSLHTIDPAAPQKSPGDTQAGFQISVSCLERSTLHYQLAIRPVQNGWKSGFHRIVIQTTRRHVRLFYRHNYYVGLEAAPDATPTIQAAQIEKLLQRAACAYPDTPLSINIVARLLKTNRADALGYAVTVSGNSLAYLTFRGDEPSSGTEQGSQGNLRRIQLDYAACTFDGNGRPVSFFHVPVEQVLTEQAYSRALVDGFPHDLPLPMNPNVAVTRFVVRDRITGNLGAVNEQSSAPEQPSPTPPPNLAFMTKTNLQLIKETGDRQGFSGPNSRIKPQYFHPPQGPIGSFGSIVVAPDSFCGDVYELHRTSDSLPDFRELDPIGSLYTASLDVPNQDFSNTEGIPGVTPRTDLFGIDYHGTFWVSTPGEYQFLMLSDDGARLEIDDRKIIDLDGLHTQEADAAHIRLNEGPHTIHVPYYQGAPESVALVLWVKPPGAQEWSIFDLHDYSADAPSPQ